MESKGISGLYRYVPNFINEEEEAYLLRKIAESPQSKWRNVTQRRLQIWGGEIGPNKTLIPEPLPPFLNSFPDIITRLASTGAFADSKHKAPNHVIINEYAPGQGIMPHEDGSAYHPVVATISLGSHTVFHYHRYKPDLDSNTTPPGEHATNQPSAASMEIQETRGRAIDPVPILSLLLEPRSVIITTGDLYTSHLHSISNATTDYFATPTPQESAELADSSSRSNEEDVMPSRIMIGNSEQLGDEGMKAVVRSGGELERKMRVSLTCRDVERVSGLRVGLVGGRRK